jgi:hypothetical protein
MRASCCLSLAESCQESQRLEQGTESAIAAEPAQWSSLSWSRDTAAETRGQFDNTQQKRPKLKA